MTRQDGAGSPVGTTPNGCRWCGALERGHYRRWKPSVGWHQWTPPTDEQRKARMLARRSPTDPGRGGLSSAARRAA
ncbi:hypothetical protein B0293_41960 [Amycolatopsis azurea DSM 43854]|uniref:Uncharacterized protein n=1 Tax=Amycolatopsis azurea DSM 43854 TaxID=1238180 RepID=A0ABX3J031_9PSEU|nr:hypothetical protein B0293_41960 [Amycolatopsis azurea DSM 43854]